MTKNEASTQHNFTLMYCDAGKGDAAIGITPAAVVWLPGASDSRTGPTAARMNAML
jgi:hypothetical protein